jgi:hypothetical protein
MAPTHNNKVHGCTEYIWRTIKREMLRLPGRELVGQGSGEDSPPPLACRWRFQRRCQYLRHTASVSAEGVFFVDSTGLYLTQPDSNPRQVVLPLWHEPHICSFALS